eukprot:SAG11_NODE_5730_length_1477_cov_0.889695_3_plen_110_part_01
MSAHESAVAEHEQQLAMVQQQHAQQVMAADAEADRRAAALEREIATLKRAHEEEMTSTAAAQRRMRQEALTKASREVEMERQKLKAAQVALNFHLSILSTVSTVDAQRSC